MKNRTKLQRAAGFTLSELLLVVVLIALIAAFAIPAAFSLRARLNMTELDAAARAIFTAAQDNVTGRKITGTLPQLDGANLVQSGEEGKICFLSTDNPGDAALLELLLPAGAVEPEIASNHYMIEFNQTFGTVLEVYYAREALPPSGDLFLMGGNDETAQVARKDAKIGYYDGGDAWNTPLHKLPSPTIQIQNKDALKIIVTVPNAAKVMRSAELFITLKSAVDSANTREIKLSSADLITSGQATLVLDSLDGAHFKDLYPEFEPGIQLMVSALLRPLDGGGAEQLLPSYSNIIYTNSLFADLQGDAASIAYARHLQNLSPDVSGVNQGRNPTVTSAIQTQDITWPGGSFTPITNEYLLRYDGGSHLIRDLTIAGYSGKLSSGLFGDISYPMTTRDRKSLQNIVLVNPTVTAPGSATQVGALAGTADYTDFTNCSVYVSVTSQSGAVQYDRYSDYGITASGLAVGGLVGYASDSNFTDCFVALPHISARNVTALGGFIGMADGCQIKNSYAAIDQIKGSAGTIGMFLGEAKTALRASTITNAYAVGNISATATSGKYYGFTGGVCTTRNAYCATTYLNADGSSRSIAVYPFTASTFSSCAYLELTDPVTAKAGFAQYGSSRTREELSAWRGSDASVWAMRSNGESFPYQKELSGMAYPFPGLQRAGGTALWHYGSWPALRQLWLAYYEIDIDNVLALQMDAQPDDPAAPVAQLPGTGKELRQDGYAIVSPVQYATPPEITWQISATEYRTAACLPYADTPVTIGDGAYYLYLFPAEAVQSAYATADFYQAVSCFQARFWYNPHFAAAMSPGKNAPVDHPDTVRLRSARQLSNLGRHPEYWSLNANQERTLSFQSYSAAYLGAPLTQPCIGSITKPYTGSYNSGDLSAGVYYQITGLPVGTDGGYSGLFGAIGKGGSVQNVHLYPDSFAAPTGAGYGGILAGSNEGTIYFCRVVLTSSLDVGGASFGGLVGQNAGEMTYCSLYSSSAGFTGTGSVAGFVSNNMGTIRLCSVQPMDYDYGAFSVLSTRGGAFGFLSGNSGTVTDCYAVGTVSGASTASGFAGRNSGTLARSYANCIVTGVQSASGFVEQNTGTKLTDCYALLSVTSGGRAAGFSANSSSGALQNCYSAATVTAGSADKRFAFAPKGATFVRCYYLEGDYDDALQGGTATGYDALSTLLVSGSGGVWTTNNADYSYPFDSALTVYPFPRLSMPHLGDWPLKPVAMPDGLVYYEQYDDNSYGFYGFDRDGGVLDLLQGNEREIVSAGYGVMVKTGDAAPTISYGANSAPLPAPFQENPIRLSSAQRVLYLFTAQAGDTLSDFQDSGKPHTLRLALSPPSGAQQVYGVNMNFAAAVTEYGTQLGSADLPIQIRTPDQFQAISRYDGGSSEKSYHGALFAQTHDVLCDGAFTTGVIRDYTYDGRGNRLLYPQSTPFGPIGSDVTVSNVILYGANASPTGRSTSFGLFTPANYGTIQNCLILDATFTAAGALEPVAGFVGQNASTGVIENCCFVGAVTGKTAAGFSYGNAGVITNCYVNATVTGTDVASGFSGGNGGVIDSCYSSGRVVQDRDTPYVPGNRAAGFALDNGGGMLKNSYSTASVSAEQQAPAYSFSPLGGGTVTNCYFLQPDAKSAPSAGAYRTYGALSSLSPAVLGGGWTEPTAPRSHPTDPTLGNLYPFPMLKSLDHYGNWPAPSVDLLDLCVVYYQTTADGGRQVTIAGLDVEMQNGQRLTVEALAPNVYAGPAALPQQLGERGFAIFISDALRDDKFSQIQKFTITCGANVDMSLKSATERLGSLLGSSGAFYPVGDGLDLSLYYAHNGGGGSAWSYRFLRKDGLFTVDPIG